MAAKTHTSITDIIVVGANGRMGRNIISLMENGQDFRLAGAVDTSEHLDKIKDLPCPVADNAAAILDQVQNAVLVDFTAPQASLKTARAAAEHGARLVIGTTGLDEPQKTELALLAEQTPILWSANMSIGVNVLLRFLPLLAEALGPDYDMEMLEVHHKRKKDAPSGTALMLGEALASARGWHLPDVRRSGRNGIIGERPQKEIGIMALRGGDVVGIHKCYFFGPGETIEIGHQAQSRENFAQGALRAARWLSRKEKGRLYSMGDVIENVLPK